MGGRSEETELEPPNRRAPPARKKRSYQTRSKLRAKQSPESRPSKLATSRVALRRISEARAAAKEYPRPGGLRKCVRLLPEKLRDWNYRTRSRTGHPQEPRFTPGAFRRPRPIQGPPSPRIQSKTGPRATQASLQPETWVSVPHHWYHQPLAK